jgi:DNA replication protein DnaC
MRTEEKWDNQFRKKCLSKFTPRIAFDLENIETPDDLSKGETQSTFIYGDIESGKTIRAAFMMLQEMKHLYVTGDESNKYESILFVSFPDLFAEIRETFDNPKKHEAVVMEKYLNAHLLVIDDFLTIRPTEWVMEILYRLINHRYEYMKKTIITSNLSLEELEKKLNDQRITSRINRMCVLEYKKRGKF